MLSGSSLSDPLHTSNSLSEGGAILTPLQYRNSRNSVLHLIIEKIPQKLDLLLSYFVKLI
jgi:hypothetical protein